MIPGSPALRFQRPEHLIHEGRDGQRDAVLPARLKRYPEVLVVERDLATRLEVTGKELLPLYIHGLFAARPPESTSMSFPGSTPAPEPSTRASDTAWRTSATTT